MTPFTINTRVRVIATPSRWHGQAGVIRDVAAGMYHVDLPGGPAWFYPHEIQHQQEEPK